MLVLETKELNQGSRETQQEVDVISVDPGQVIQAGFLVAYVETSVKSKLVGDIAARDHFIQTFCGKRSTEDEREAAGRTWDAIRASI